MFNIKITCLFLNHLMKFSCCLLLNHKEHQPCGKFSVRRHCFYSFYLCNHVEWGHTLYRNSYCCFSCLIDSIYIDQYLQSDNSTLPPLPFLLCIWTSIFLPKNGKYWQVHNLYCIVHKFIWKGSASVHLEIELWKVNRLLSGRGAQELVVQIQEDPVTSAG